MYSWHQWHGIGPDMDPDPQEQSPTEESTTESQVPVVFPEDTLPSPDYLQVESD